MDKEFYKERNLAEAIHFCIKKGAEDVGHEFILKSKNGSYLSLSISEVFGQLKTFNVYLSLKSDKIKGIHKNVSSIEVSEHFNIELFRQALSNVYEVELKRFLDKIKLLLGKGTSDSLLGDKELLFNIDTLCPIFEVYENRGIIRCLNAIRKDGTSYYTFDEGNEERFIYFKEYSHPEAFPTLVQAENYIRRYWEKELEKAKMMLEFCDQGLEIIDLTDGETNNEQ